MRWGEREMGRKGERRPEHGAWSIGLGEEINPSPTWNLKLET
jgi:hypothetical protein